MDVSENYKVIRYKVAGMRQSIFTNSIWISGEREADYLLSGHATELVDRIHLSFTGVEIARIYGVVAANREKGRYVWVYLFTHHHLWRCHSISEACKIVEKVKSYMDLYKKERKLFEKMLLERRKAAKRIDIIKPSMQN